MPRKALETAAREGRFEREAERVRKDGSRFWAHIIIDAIRDDEGELIGFAKITRDITKRKEAQEKSKRRVSFRSRRRNWRRLVNSQAESPMILTTC